MWVKRRMQRRSIGDVGADPCVCPGRTHRSAPTRLGLREQGGRTRRSALTQSGLRDQRGGHQHYLTCLAELFSCISFENPLNTISIIKLPVYTERHIMQLLKSLFFCSICKFVKNCFQFIIFITNNKYCRHVAQYWIKYRRSHPVCSRDFKLSTF